MKMWKEGRKDVRFRGDVLRGRMTPGDHPTSGAHTKKRSFKFNIELTDRVICIIVT